MLAKALETTPPQAPALPGLTSLGSGISGRFARDASEFAAPLRQSRRHLAVVPDPTNPSPGSHTKEEPTR
jgi:hypothetical protein